MLILLGVGAVLYFVTRPAPVAAAPIIVAAPEERRGTGENIGGAIGSIIDSIIEEIG